MTSSFQHTSQRASRRGASLMEIMVVMAIMLGVAAVMVPGTRSVMQLDQRQAARKLALQYERIHDEAVMRSRTIRVAYDLKKNTYTIEAGESGALVAATPEEKEDFDEKRRQKMRLMSDDDKAKYLAKNKQPFESLGDDGKLEVELPTGVQIYGVYTPQYGRMMTLEEIEESRERGDDSAPVVYSYVMSNGFTEHTVIWLIATGDPSDGWTIEIEPLSGKVHMHGELLEWEDSYDFVPSEGPTLQL